MRDPYEVLGVKKTADAAAIKSAYRKLAKKLHPDANKNDPKAAQRFAEINSAYEILGEDDKRKAFDRGEIDAEGKPRFAGFEGFGPGGMVAAAARGADAAVRTSILRSSRSDPKASRRSRRRAARAASPIWRTCCTACSAAGRTQGTRPRRFAAGRHDGAAAATICLRR